VSGDGYNGGGRKRGGFGKTLKRAEIADSTMKKLLEGRAAEFAYFAKLEKKIILLSTCKRSGGGGVKIGGKPKNNRGRAETGAKFVQKRHL